jgi:hypothetical protein
MYHRRFLEELKTHSMDEAVRLVNADLETCLEARQALKNHIDEHNRARSAGSL